MAEFKQILTLQTESGQSVSIDLRSALILSTAPTASTAARAGMQAYVVSGGTITAEYVCTAVSGSTYTWVQREVSGGGSSEAEKEIFFARNSSASFQDILDAHQNGKLVVVDDGTSVHMPVQIGRTSAVFYRTNGTTMYVLTVTSDDSWETINYNLQNTTDKVSSIDDTSTDKQYPSAKAVYDYAVPRYYGTKNARARLVVGDDGFVKPEFPIVDVSETGDIVSVRPMDGTDISVVSHIDRVAKWENSNALWLHHTNGGSLVDIAGIVRAKYGTSWTVDGISVTLNDDDSMTIVGTANSTETYVQIFNMGLGEDGYKMLLPPGTYTLGGGIIMAAVGISGEITGTIGSGWKSLGNKEGTFTVDEPFWGYTTYYAVRNGTTVNKTIPLSLMRGSKIPDTGFGFTGQRYEARFSSYVGSGTFNWQTGELRDADGNLVEKISAFGPFPAFDGVNEFIAGGADSSVTYSIIGDSSAGAVIGQETPEEKARQDLMQSITVEYGRTLNTGYQLVRIPRTTNNGRRVRPVVRMTSVDGTMNGVKCSTLTYAKREKTAFALNAGLFDTQVNPVVPLGQTIIDGVSILNERHPQGANNETISDTECYPLCVDGDGNLSAPYPNTVDTADMIADGIVQACTGWVTMVEDYEIAADEIASEIVHTGKYIQNIIGQFDNGDYCVLSTSKAGYQNNPAPKDEGLTKTEAAQLLVDRGVRFAYALDGGGSAQTVLGERHINPIYEGSAGRAIPVVIVFVAE